MFTDACNRILVLGQKNFLREEYQKEWCFRKNWERDIFLKVDIIEISG